VTGRRAPLIPTISTLDEDESADRAEIASDTDEIVRVIVIVVLGNGSGDNPNRKQGDP